MVPRLGSAKFIRTIDEIIAALSPKHSSVEEFALSGEEEWVKVGKEGATMMPLSIESTTWQGTPSLSVMHYYIQSRWSGSRTGCRGATATSVGTWAPTRGTSGTA